MPYTGEFAALTAAFFWGFGALLFESAGTRIGAFATNLLRLVLACFFLSVTLYFQAGFFFPLHASMENHLWLGLSGIIGLAIGDGALFYAIVILGPRLSTLLLSLAPPITTIIAWIFLGETLGFMAIAGISLTLLAIIWVVSEKHKAEHIRGSKALGVLFGIVAALGQGVGVILAKMGLTGNIDSLSATLLRMVPATVGLWLVALLTRQARPSILALKNKMTALIILGGALFGPYIGVWLSVVAVKYTKAGIASTLLSTVPILIIPLDFFVHRRKPSLRAIVGTILAVAGIALIFAR
jgi:drug/metabolite transporter (DMT)-like permease